MQVYIDDMFVILSSKNDHLDHLQKSIDRINKYGLKMNTLKYAFGVHAGNFLGFVVKKRGIEINQKKTRGILSMKPPSNKK